MQTLFIQLCTIAVTAAPGVQRLAFISVLAAQVSAARVGLIASDLGIAAFLSLLSGGAVASQLLAIWPRAGSATARKRISKQVMVWQALTLVAGCLVVALLGWNGIVADVTGAVAVFVGLSVWQAARTKRICDRSYLRLGVIEVLLTIAVVAAAWLLVDSSALLAAYGISLCAASSLSVAKERSGATGAFDGNEMNLGMRSTATHAVNGALSSGREALIVPVVRLVGSEHLAGIVAQVSAVVAAILLLPRAITFARAPTIAASFRSGYVAGHIVARYKREVNTVLLLCFLASGLGLAIGMLAGIDASYLQVGVLATIALICGQWALVPSTVLTCCQRARPIAFSSAILMVGWVAAIWIIHFLSIPALSAVSALFAAGALLAVARGWYLQRRAGQLLIRSDTPDLCESVNC